MANKTCPKCGAAMTVFAVKCTQCGEFVNPEFKPAPSGSAGIDRFVLPVGRPGSAIAAGYFGLFSCFPFVGLLAGLLAVLFGVMALRAIRRDPSLSGAGRAWFGIILGCAMIVVQAILIVSLIITSQRPHAGF